MQPIALELTPDDVAYVRTHYLPLAELTRGIGEEAWLGNRLPRATYQLSDGSTWYPRDWWRLADEAGGVAQLPEMFARRLRAASEAVGHPCDPDEAWHAYLAGLYGACLREVTPEAIVRKERLVARLEHALREPRPATARGAPRSAPRSTHSTRSAARSPTAIGCGSAGPPAAIA